MADKTASITLDFLRFIEEQPTQSTSKLLDRILHKSRLLTRAEAGTIFVLNKRGRRPWLEPVSIQNDVLRVRNVEFVIPLDSDTIAGYVARTGRRVAIDDVYHIPPSRSYRFDPGHERKSYRTCSMLCFALKNLQGDVIGVVQLINAKSGKRRLPVPFKQSDRDLIVAMSPIIGHLIERNSMMEKIRTKNRELRRRNQLLREHAEKIAGLQRDTEAAFQHSITLLSRASEIHDEDTGNHILRVNYYSERLGLLLGQTKEWCRQLGYSAQLHDVGKMSVDVAVLKKRGRLTVSERHEMNRHTVYGWQILHNVPRFEMAAEIALNHHERWDGGGYPNGLRGEEIPLSARITQIADVYDAMRSERSYKPAWSHERTVQVLVEGDDRLDPKKSFDPHVLGIFLANHEQFDQIWKSMQDTGTSSAKTH